MRSREELEKCRGMTVSARLALTFKLSNEKLPLLFRGTPEEVERRFELMRRDKAERNQLILEAIGRAKLGENRTGGQPGHAIDSELANDPVLAKEIEEWL